MNEICPNLVLQHTEQTIVFEKGSNANSSFCVDPLNSIYAITTSIQSGEAKTAALSVFDSFVFSALTPEQWTAADQTAISAGCLNVTMRSDQFLWDGSKAILICNRDRFDENVKVISQFVYCELQTQRMEKEIVQNWDKCNGLIKYSHQINAAQLKHWTEVGQMTEHVASLRSLYQSIAGLSTSPSNSLTAPARRAVLELSVASRLQERLTLIDDQIEVMQDICEIANDRFVESSNFHSEIWLEKLIVVLLLIEVVLLLIDPLAKVLRL